MKYIKAFVLFWVDFIVGDDWRIAVMVVVGMTTTAVCVTQGVAAWWVLPIMVATYLAVSMTRKSS